MLSEKQARKAIRILSLLLAAVFSFFVLTAVVPESRFIDTSLESVEESSRIVMKFSAATLSTSLAISALPDDFATPLAETLADMNVYFVAILVILFLEKILIQYGLKLAFAIMIPAACILGIIFLFYHNPVLKGFAVRLCVLGLAVALVVPFSTHVTEIVAADLMEYVQETITDTENGAEKLHTAMDGETEEQNMFEKLSDLFQTAIRDITDLMQHFQNTIRRCMNSIAILILTNCLMPLLTFFVLKWILKETFQIVIPAIPTGKAREEQPSKAIAEPVSAGE